ncbi:glycoside hydrolase family 38 N-terminal domain-containing protein [Elizabethkingia meningoseptica]|uniref:glycoside hydrolase family 38 N-terminal domain-containing protein n=1 Tax=Elizabethkingia meningoseptica TaxID=238 RepID=UPI000332BE5E|nr:glycoside hydrolase family 38 C-terminal domain-containing protein [Elizabethkingia meningoseptica]EOR31354.1 Glycosyl hydrolases family 38 C-terminal domain protein [Elizabethkingia meningoseptica ATCC 13253 = NBRC 12535]SQG06508.1 Alpha-mannosidase [Elizabethkingia meningoseptica]
MHNRYFLLLVSLFITNSLMYAQKKVPFFGSIQSINGYATEISGENIDYFSAFPDHATRALLTRATDGAKTIEWETAPAPQKITAPYVYFSWLVSHSSGSSGGIRNFDLYINNQKSLTLTTYPVNQKPNWIAKAADSTAFVFNQTKMDGLKDSYGIAYLRIPASKVTPGKPIRLKIVGQAQDSRDWFMTYKFTFQEKMDAASTPFILKDGKRLITLTTLHFGPEQKITATIDNKENFSFTMPDGIKTFDIPVTLSSKGGSVALTVTSGNKQLLHKTIQAGPVVPRTLYFIHHSHTDVGYSHLQSEVEKIHTKNIYDALKMIEETRNLPEEARFKWNVEALWDVENFMQKATAEEKKSFVKAVKEGNIGLSAMYANILTGLSQPEELFHYTEYAQKLEKEYGLNITSAMMSDVPGFAWSLVPALTSSGVKYFSSGPNYLGKTNPYLGDRVGNFVKNWGDKPVWWESPSGEEKILFWTAGRGYSSWHGIHPGAVFENGQKKIAEYLEDLTKTNYPYDIVQWRYNIVSDNGPIDPSISKFVDEWNKKYTSPKIVLSTNEKMFEVFEKKYGDKIPVVKGDISPHWEDGAMSTAKEEGLNRNSSLKLQQLTTLYSMLNPGQYNNQSFYEAWRNVILFHEHTWGAFNSITAPDLPFATDQWKVKKQFSLDGSTLANKLEADLLQPLTDPASNIIAVYNTSSWVRDGLVILPVQAQANAVQDFKGNKTPLQKLENGTMAFIARNIPPLSSATYTIIKDSSPKTSVFSITDHSISNGKINLTWDNKTGSITHFTDNNGTTNYAGTFNNQGLNSYWYVPGTNPQDSQSNTNVQVNVLENGPVLAKISLTSEAPGAHRLEKIITLISGSDEVTLENIINKKPIRTKESVHFGFPFNKEFKNITADAGYGVMKYLTDQLPGSNMDYWYSRRWVDASFGQKGMQWMLLEAPLIEAAEMIDERLQIDNSHKKWKDKGTPDTTNWFSYAMNNYWHTNYKADQEGPVHYRYALRPHGTFNSVENEKYAAAFTQPLIAIPVNKKATVKGSLFHMNNDKIVVTTITPQEDHSFIIRLYNPDEKEQSTTFIWEQLKPSKLIHLKTEKTISINDTISLNGMDVIEIKAIP